METEVQSEQEKGSVTSMKLGLGVMIQLVIIIVGLGVAFGSIRAEMETMKITQTTLDANQTAILHKLGAIERNMVRIGYKLNIKLED